jgi:H+/Cl- antiporter ClcA
MTGAGAGNGAGNGRLNGRLIGRMTGGGGAHLLQWAVLGAAVGVLAGAGSTVFLRSLEWATRTREHHPWLLWLLPVAGIAVGLAHRFLGGRAVRGTNLLLDDLYGHHAGVTPESPVPRRMAPLVLAGATATHLFGGSGGREGAAVQITAGLVESVLRPLRRWWNPVGDTRVLLLIAVFGGAFGAVFGVPAAGAVFGIEVVALGVLRSDALVGSVTASVVGDRVAHALGIRHTPIVGPGVPPLDAGLAARLVLLGIACGLAARAFVMLTEGVRTACRRGIPWPPLRLAAGGVIICALTILVGSRDYNGLGLPLIDAALAGAGVAGVAFAWKLLFTGVTIGSGFPGGEVTPLLCVGACLGSALATPLGLPRALLACVAFAAVFGAASNTPLACTVLVAELLGAAYLVPALVVTVVAWRVSGSSSVYDAQRAGAWRVAVTAAAPDAAAPDAAAPVAAAPVAPAAGRGRSV